MRSAFSIFLLAASALVQNPANAQNKAPGSAPQNSCGPSDLKFEVEHDNSQLPPSEPERGKALIFVIETFDNTAGSEAGVPTVRVGLDGSWIGANRGSSYLFFSIDPGEHHLCANWQTLKHPSAQPSRMDFTAEAGKSYFFQARIHSQTASGGGEVWSIDLQPATAEEAKYLIADSPLSVSHPKK